MAEATKIEWCHHTFNPWVGCAKVSPGCANCYAAVDTPARVARSGGVELWGKNADRQIKADSGWREPLAWDRAAAKAGERRRVFCLSQGDWLEDRWDLDAPRLRLLDLIDRTPNLDWLLLTKRPEQFKAVLLRAVQRVPGDVDTYDRAIVLGTEWLLGRPPANVWVGVSVEDQPRADERIPALLKIPAKVRFLSVEPLLGPVDLAPWLDRLDWVIVGGESGPKARPCNLAWIRSVVDQCKAAGVPCFVKQLGRRLMIDSTGGSRFDDHTYFKVADPKGGDPSEWPEDLRVRQFPGETKQ